MNTLRPRLALVITWLGLASISGAQTSPAPKADPAQDRPSEKVFNPFGDTKKFTRMGGWGGIGGAMGQWGFGQSMLVMTPTVQAELKLTDKQKKELREWSESMRERAQSMFRRPGRDQTQDVADGGEGQPNPGDGQAGRPGLAEMFAMMNNMSAMLRENETGVQKILTKDQRKRLAQITLQMEGLSAVARPEVSSLLNLSEGQIFNIQQILSDLRTRQMGLWMQQAIAMQSERAAWTRNRDQASRPEPTTTDATPKASTRSKSAAALSEKKEAKPSEPPLDEEARRAEATKRFRQRFDSMRQSTDQLQEATVLKIYKVLTKRQRAVFDQLLGDPFDVDKMVKEGGMGPRRPGQEASPSETKTPASPNEASHSPQPAPNRKSTRLRDLRKGTPADDSK